MIPALPAAEHRLAIGKLYENGFIWPFIQFASFFHLAKYKSFQSNCMLLYKFGYITEAVDILKEELAKNGKYLDSKKLEQLMEANPENHKRLIRNTVCQPEKAGKLDL